MYRASHVIYTIIAISTAWYFNQSLPVFHITDSSYRSPYSSKPIRTWHTGSVIRTREWPNNKCSCHHHCLYYFYYVNWKPNDQWAL